MTCTLTASLDPLVGQPRACSWVAEKDRHARRQDMTQIMVNSLLCSENVGRGSPGRLERHQLPRQQWS